MDVEPESPFFWLPPEYRIRILLETREGSPATGLPLLSSVCRQWRADLADLRLRERPEGGDQVFANAAAIECSETLWDFYCAPGAVDADQALVAAAHAGSIRGMVFAKEHGDVSMYTKAFHAASRAGHPACMQRLARMSSFKFDGASICLLEFGDSLILAAQSGHPKCMRMALALDKELRSGNLSGEANYALDDALWNATKAGHPDCIQVVADARRIDGQDINEAMQMTAEEGHVDCLEKLIQLDNIIEESLCNWDRILVLSAVNGHVDCVRKAIEKGAKVFGYALELATQIQVCDDRHIIEVMDEEDAVARWYRNRPRARHLECIVLLARKGAELWDTQLDHGNHDTSEKCVRLMLRVGVEAPEVAPKMREELVSSHKDCLMSFARKCYSYEQEQEQEQTHDADMERFLVTEKAYMREARSLEARFRSPCKRSRHEMLPSISFI